MGLPPLSRRGMKKLPINIVAPIMPAPTLAMKLTQRKDSDVYHAQLNQSTYDILSLIFEFKSAASWHIARFLTQKDQSTYLYRKLRRMWQANLLESFKVFTGSLAGLPVYYTLSREGLKTLEEKGIYSHEQIRAYPQVNVLLSGNIFKHEARVVELASMEAKNASKGLKLSFKGEISSVARDLRSDIHNIEVFTPDYMVVYKLCGREFTVYTEFERTAKSTKAMTRKIGRYLNHLSHEERIHVILRFIFETQSMEQSFWFNMILSDKAYYLENIKIMTTNVALLQASEQFHEPIYVSKDAVKLTKQDRLAVDISHRVKLLPFL